MENSIFDYSSIISTLSSMYLLTICINIYSISIVFAQKKLDSNKIEFLGYRPN